MKKATCFFTLLLLTTCFSNAVMGQDGQKEKKRQEVSGADLYEKSKKINAMMKGVSLTPRSTATADDKKLLKQFEKVYSLSLKVEKEGAAASGRDLGQQLQLALQESVAMAKLRKTGKITLFPNDCYDQCDDQVGFGAAWNEFFCVFKCFKAAVVHFD